MRRLATHTVSVGTVTVGRSKADLVPRHSEQTDNRCRTPLCGVLTCNSFSLSILCTSMFVSLLVFVLFVLEELHSVVGSSTVGDIIKSTDVFLLLPQWCFLRKHTPPRIRRRNCNSRASVISAVII
jgi:hypothetical protein